MLRYIGWGLFLAVGGYVAYRVFVPSSPTMPRSGRGGADGQGADSFHGEPGMGSLGSGPVQLGPINYMSAKGLYIAFVRRVYGVVPPITTEAVYSFAINRGYTPDFGPQGQQVA